MAKRKNSFPLVPLAIGAGVLYFLLRGKAVTETVQPPNPNLVTSETEGSTEVKVNGNRVILYRPGTKSYF